MAPAVLLLESSVVSEAGAPDASEAEGSGRTVPRSPSGPRPPVEGRSGRAPAPFFPDGAAPFAGGPPAPPSRASCKAGGTAASDADGGMVTDGSGTPEGGEPPLDVSGFGWGSRGGAAIGRWLPESGTRTSAVTQTGELSRFGDWRK